VQRRLYKKEALTTRFCDRLHCIMKRAGLAHKIHSFTDNNVESIADLLAIEGSDVPAKAKTLKKEHSLSMEEATDLAEIISQTTSTRRALFNFGLHSRKRIIKTFVLFYHESQHDPVDMLSAKDDENTDTDDVSVAAEFKQNKEKKGEIAPALAQTYDAKTLNDLGFAFGVKVTSSRGHGLVSLIEVLNHLKKYSRDPAAAVASVDKELLNPPYPEPPLPEPPKPKPTEWVYKWLKRGEGKECLDENEEGVNKCDAKAGDVEADDDDEEKAKRKTREEEDMSEYAKSFIDAGLKNRSDLVAPPLLTDALLKSELGVSKLGHRRKILRMQQKLQEEEGALVVGTDSISGGLR
jgi:hypothetical protein